MRVSKGGPSFVPQKSRLSQVLFISDKPLGRSIFKPFSSMFYVLFLILPCQFLWIFWRFLFGLPHFFLLRFVANYYASFLTLLPFSGCCLSSGVR